jgi:hypothetical protein
MANGNNNGVANERKHQWRLASRLQYQTKSSEMASIMA